jgi:hypothetical protein
MNDCGTAQNIAHDCYAWQRQQYCSSVDAHYSMCGTCGRITGFRWKKIWPRIRSLFTSNPLKSTIDLY